MRILIAIAIIATASACATRSEFDYLRKVHTSIHVGMRRSDVVRILGKPIYDFAESAYYGLPVIVPPDESPVQAYTVVILYRNGFVQQVHLAPSKQKVRRGN